MKQQLEKALKDAKRFGGYVCQGLDGMAREPYGTKEYINYKTLALNAIYLSRQESEESYKLFLHMYNGIRQIKGDYL